MHHGFTLYQGRDPRELPAYGITEAARYVHIPPATLRSWVAGRTYPRQDGIGSFQPLIRAAGQEGVRLSFGNLVEAHVLRALRTQHGVEIRAVRNALTYAEQELKIERLLLSNELLTDAGDIFLEYYGELLDLSRSGQIVMKKVLEAHLRRVERDDRDIPIRLYPFLPGEVGSDRRTVVIDPFVSFGRPTVAGHGVTTAVLVGRVDAGESIEDLSDDYDIPQQEIEEAILFERAA
ncbi:MAG TPA: DUF433 domain-containing protein [Longimicrobiaceae bacterium]